MCISGRTVGGWVGGWVGGGGRAGGGIRKSVPGAGEHENTLAFLQQLNGVARFAILLQALALWLDAEQNPQHVGVERRVVGVLSLCQQTQRCFCILRVYFAAWESPFFISTRRESLCGILV